MLLSTLNPMKPLKTIVWERWSLIIAGLLIVMLTLTGDGPPPRDLRFRLNTLTASRAFNFVTWELEALARKTAFGLLSPQRFMDDEAQARLVLAHLDDISRAYHLERAIQHIYADPAILDPDVASREEQAELDALRWQMRRASLVAEAVLGEQVSTVLQEGGFGVLGQILPPVSGTFTPLPKILIVSPRATIVTDYQHPLIAEMTPADKHALEEAVMAAQPDHAAYVTSIGGLATYPAMLLESSSIDWIADVIAHEWAHHYLIFYPLGWYYMVSHETRAINETTATLIGEWAGQEVVLRYYAPHLARPKRLPDPLVAEEHPPDAPPRFDFRAEMHQTRVTVDELLADGQIEEAERYMEARRRYFVAQGYEIRRLNQAYFAFHGAYAAAPGGAAGEDPIGPAVRRLWALSPTPRNFTRRIALATTLEEVYDLLRQ